MVKSGDSTAVFYLIFLSNFNGTGMKRYIILLTLVGLLNIYAQTEKATQLSGNLMFDSRLAFEHYKN